MSGAMSRRKGSTAERAVVNWLNNNGFPNAERRGTGLPGADVADLGPGLELEIKNHARIELAAWIDQLTDAMAATDADMGAVIVKRSGTTDVSRWWFIQPAHLSQALCTTATTVPACTHLGRLDMAKAAARIDVVDRHDTTQPPPVAIMTRPRVQPLDHYAVTTVAHGIRLLRQAGYGDPLEGP